MFDLVFFIGPVGFSHVCDRAWHGVSMIRYGDEDMSSPSCCDWIIPGKDW
jgi:hypothetical protein